MTTPAVLELTMVMNPDGTGTASLVYAGPREGVAEFSVSNWRRAASGVLKGTLTHRPRSDSPDPWFEGYLRELLGATEG